jgi:hypothetical protein
VRVVSGTCPYSEALNNGDAYIQSISDVTNFAFYCVFALALVDCIVPRSLLVSVEDTFAFTLVDRRRSAPALSTRALDGNHAARVAAHIFARSARAPRRSSADAAAAAAAPLPPPPPRRRRGCATAAAAAACAGARRATDNAEARVVAHWLCDDDADEKAALYVDWRRARPDVLVLREAGPSHDVPPFESTELVNAAARLGELIKATIACCCSFSASPCWTARSGST